MYCSKCGNEIKDGANFCANCGEKLSFNNSTNKRVCPNCGAELLYENQNNCTECGASLNYNVVNNTAVNYNVQRKSKLAAGLLQILIPGFGVGRFYLGYTSIAIAQIVVSILTCGIGTLWPFIDGILILTGSVTTDANGNPLGD